jgi:hypothetical protein
MVVMRRAMVLALVAALAGTLWYLRDPAWLIDQTTGLRPAERAPDGSVFRWSGGHASFFVPSDATAIRIPLATTFDARGAAPMVVTVFVDDVRAGRVLLTDDRWQSLTIPLPPRGSRRVWRIDIRTSVVREDNHGVKLGEVQVIRAAFAKASAGQAGDQ